MSHASPSYNTILVGSGINALICALTLADAGQKVLVLERRAKPGGCVDTREVTLPGFRHDMMAMSWPLFVTSPHFPRWEAELHTLGVTFFNAEWPTATVLPDGRNVTLTRSRQENVSRLNALSDGDGTAYAMAMDSLLAQAPFVFGMLGNAPLGTQAGLTAWRALRRYGFGGMRALASPLLEPMRAWLERDFRSDLTRALLAPWILHAGQSPDEPMSGLIGKAITLSIETAGAPLVAGGGDELVKALISMIEKRGGTVSCAAEVMRVLHDGRKTRGVRLADGQQVASRRVVCDVTPGQLYGLLLDSGTKALEEARHHAVRYRFGRGCMQIHLALSAPPAWHDPALGAVALLHITPGLDGVLRASGEAQRGLLPAEATIVVGQPAHADPSRCPAGRSILWIQLQELPFAPIGDAAGTLASACSGCWTTELAEAYADRIIARLETHIPGLRGQIMAQAVLSPADLAACNVNLEQGDPYSGACGIDQFHLNRGIPTETNYRTSLRGLWRIGASTHPGPGLGGMSGYLAAQEILSRTSFLSRMFGRAS